MILIGQFDSPFVRRVGIAMRLYGIEFEHRPWSTFGDADRLREVNPLTRVPTLVLDSGDVLVDSHTIIDYIDFLAPAGQALFPTTQPARHHAMKVTALATGLSDKAVSTFYERVFHKERSQIWLDRCRGQIERAVNALETDRADRATDYWFGGSIGHADIAVTCSLRHLTESLPDLVELDRFPALATHCKRLEALPVFQEIQQAFIPPA